MPRPTRAYGRPGTPVIPENWAESHAQVIAKTWTAACKIFPPRGAGDEYVINADLTVTGGAAPTALYDGPCRIQQLNSQETRAVIGDQEQVTAGYLVVIHRDALVPNRSVIAIAAVDDDELAARELVVRKVGKGSQIWERDLFAVEDQTDTDQS